jgi:uncharacterized membrane protein
MSWSQGIKAVHVLIGFGFVAGLVGRGVTLASARRTERLDIMEELLSMAGRFDRLLVIPGSIAVLVAGVITMLSQGRSLFPPHGWWLGVSLILFLASIPLVPLVFLPGGKRFEAAFQAAKARGEVTPELRRAYRDPRVAFARTYEVAMVATVIVLMVTKPF